MQPSADDAVNGWCTPKGIGVRFCLAMDVWFSSQSQANFSLRFESLCPTLLVASCGAMLSLLALKDTDRSPLWEPVCSLDDRASSYLDHKSPFMPVPCLLTASYIGASPSMHDLSRELRIVNRSTILFRSEAV